MATSIAFDPNDLNQPKGYPALPSDWTVEGDSFISSDGKSRVFGLLMRRKVPTGKPALLVVHGMGEHIGRYLHLPHFLQGEVDVIYGFDLLGHGRSEGPRGHVSEFDRFAHDTAVAFRHLESRLRSTSGNPRIHLLGHSLGGLIVLRTAFLHPELPVASLTSTSPFLAVRQKVPTYKTAAAAVLNHLWKTLPMDTGLELPGLSHDTAVLEHYRTDPLNHPKMTPGFYVSLQQAIQDTLNRRSGIQWPIQFGIPLADPIIDPGTSMRYLEDLQHGKKRLVSFAGFFHEPLNEIGKDQAFAAIASWIATHSGPH